MLVYFHVDELARDAVVASALKKEIERAGGRLVYGNRLTTNHILRHFNVFDAIILSSLAHYIDVFPDTKKLPDNVFILQTEAIGQATGTLRRLYGKYFGDDAVKCEPWHRTVAGYLLWGHAHLNPFHEYFPAYLPKTRVVGHPRLSDSCKRPTPKPPNERRVVGFVSRFNLLSPHDGRHPFLSVLSTIKLANHTRVLFENSPDRDIEDLYYTEVLDFRLLYEIVMRLDPAKYDIRVRPHPRENRRGWEIVANRGKLKLTVSPWDEPFGHWLEDIDTLVTPPSTGLYDIYFHGKRAIVIDRISPKRVDHILTESDDRNQILEGACRPTSVEEVLARIEANDVPVDRATVDLRLYEQVGADIARNSIANIIAALPKLRPAIGTSEMTRERRLKLNAFRAISAIAAHLRWFKSLIQRRVEQGSSFHLTAWHSAWIARLTTK